MKRKFLVPVLLVMIVLFLPGCIPGSGSYDHQSPAGFFSGIWHGWIAPILHSDHRRIRRDQSNAKQTQEQNETSGLITTLECARDPADVLDRTHNG